MICALTADGSAAASDSSASGTDKLELGSGIAVTGSIDEDTGVSGIAGAKTFASPIAEADEPAKADAAGALSTGREVEITPLHHQSWLT